MSPTKRAYIWSITDWKMARSSAVSWRKGEPASFLSADLMARGATPIFSISPCALRVSMMTPIEPVTVVGRAMMVSPARAA